MAVADPAEIEAASARLRGHLVATPIIGGILLPGRSVPGELRVKPEVLQPSGSIHYRGVLHWLLRKLGACKGLAIHGAERPVLAAAVAAAQQRLPMVAFTIGEPDAPVWSMLKALGCEVRPRPSGEEARAAAEQVRAAEGYTVVPGAAHPDYAAGLATVGRELAVELPSETHLVVVSPSELARPIALGLLAGGTNVRVEGVATRASGTPPQLIDELRTSLRIDVGRASAVALWRAMEQQHGVVCAVLAE